MCLLQTADLNCHSLLPKHPKDRHRACFLNAGHAPFPGLLPYCFFDFSAIYKNATQSSHQLLSALFLAAKILVHVSVGKGLDSVTRALLAQVPSKQVFVILRQGLTM